MNNLTKAQKELLKLIQENPEGYKVKANYRPLKKLIELGLVLLPEEIIVRPK
jgi:hypothetical protein